MVKEDRQMGSQVSPTTHRLWFWLKDIARWDLRLALPRRGFWFWIKGIAKRDLRLVQPYIRYWFWLKGIARKDIRLAQPCRGFWFWLKGIAGVATQFLTYIFDKFSEKSKIAKKQRKTQKMYFWYICSFLAFSTSSQKNLNFQRYLERVQLA